MLILQRKERERIIIGGTIEVVICKLNSGSVSVGVQAPRDISVHRAEVQERINLKGELIDG